MLSSCPSGLVKDMKYLKADSPRPRTVILLAVIAIIIGVLSIIFGLAGVVLGAFIVGDYSGLGAAILLVLGAVVFVFGILEILYGLGFLQGKGWAWKLGMIVTVAILVTSIGVIIASAVANPADGIAVVIIFTIASSALVPVMTSSLSIYFLTRPHVKEFFGKRSGLRLN